jgi:hypothetical protein
MIIGYIGSLNIQVTPIVKKIYQLLLFCGTHGAGRNQRSGLAE